MAATVNTNAQTAAGLSPLSSSGDALGSPRLPRSSSGPAKNSSPPWNQVLCGPEVTPPVLSPVTPVMFPPPAVEENIKIACSTEVCDLDTDGFDTGNGSKKPVWNKPSNGSPDDGPVMGAVSWPSLFESTQASPKPPSLDSPKNASDFPISASQVSSAPAYSSPASSSSAPRRPIISNPNSPSPNTTTHHGRPARQKSMKRESGGNPSSNSVLYNQPPEFSSMGDASHHNSSSTKISSGGSDSPRRDPGHNSSYRDGGQRGGGDHPQQRNYRRSNNNYHFRGDGSLGGRRDQDRGNHEWNHHRNFNGRDPVGLPQRGASPRGYIRPPPAAAPYIPPPIRPYGNPIGIPSEMRSLYFLAPQPGMPFIAQMPPALYYPPDPQLHAKIINQIEYYFSNENLIRDTYLRQNMDKNGWVPIQLIVGFKKVMQLTTDVELILDALRASTVVEIQGDRMRKHDDWMRWIMAGVGASSSESCPSMRGQEMVATDMQGLMVDDC